MCHKNRGDMKEIDNITAGLGATMKAERHEGCKCMNR
jgi:hypothetical protein